MRELEGMRVFFICFRFSFLSNMAAQLWRPSRSTETSVVLITLQMGPDAGTPSLFSLWCAGPVQIQKNTRVWDVCVGVGFLFFLAECIGGRGGVEHCCRTESPPNLNAPQSTTGHTINESTTDIFTQGLTGYAFTFSYTSHRYHGDMHSLRVRT